MRPPPSDLKPVFAHSTEYSRLRSSYMRKGAPLMIFQPQSYDELSAVLHYAQSLREESNLPISVRSGGHGIAGLSTNLGGLVLDLSRFRRCQILTDEHIEIQSGAVWKDVETLLTPHERVLTSGNFGGSGVGGLTAAGGMGFFIRKHGLTIDQLHSAHLMLASGESLIASKTENPDLFWAAQGGGGQAAIALSYRFITTPLPQTEVLHQTLLQEVMDLHAFLQSWATICQDAPEELSSLVNLYPQSGIAYASTSTVWGAATPTAAAPSFIALRDAATLIDEDIQLKTYHMLLLGERASLTGQQNVKLFNGLFNEMTEDLCTAITRLMQCQEVAFIELRSLGGAMARVAPDSSAFAHRHQNLMITAWFHPNDTIHLQRLFSEIETLCDGIYSGYTSDSSAAAIAKMWPGPTGLKLKALSEQYDPNGLLTGGLSLRR